MRQTQATRWRICGPSHRRRTTAILPLVIAVAWRSCSNKYTSNIIRYGDGCVGLWDDCKLGNMCEMRQTRRTRHSGRRRSVCDGPGNGCAGRRESRWWTRRRSKKCETWMRSKRSSIGIERKPSGSCCRCVRRKRPRERERRVGLVFLILLHTYSCWWFVTLAGRLVGRTGRARTGEFRCERASCQATHTKVAEAAARNKRAESSSGDDGHVLSVPTKCGVSGKPLRIPIYSNIPW